MPVGDIERDSTPCDVCGKPCDMYDDFVDLSGNNDLGHACSDCRIEAEVREITCSQLKHDDERGYYTLED